MTIIIVYNDHNHSLHLRNFRQESKARFMVGFVRYRIMIIKKSLHKLLFSIEKSIAELVQKISILKQSLSRIASLYFLVRLF